jgi:2-dehydro-3-deoxygalactonokinase
MTRASLIGIDWGTSSFRAWAMTADGEVRDAVEKASGILMVPNGDFDMAFEEALHSWLTADPGIPVIASGMITSRNGWCETTYLPLPVRIENLAASLTPLVTKKGRTIHFVAGVAHNPQSGVPDVMRGEETELAGHITASGSGEGVFVLPGTHSKWAKAEAGAITHFETFMTGEFFSILCGHSIIGRLMTHDERTLGEASPSAFREGLQFARQGGSILSKAFSARTLALFDRLPGVDIADYLSGLLIGEEVGAALSSRSGAGPVTVIGRGELAHRYRIALAEWDADVVEAEPGMARRGLLEIARHVGLI